MAGGTLNHDNLACKAVTLINNYFEENDFPYLVNYKWEVEIERGRPVKNQHRPKGLFYKCEYWVKTNNYRCIAPYCL